MGSAVSASKSSDGDKQALDAIIMLANGSNANNSKKGKKPDVKLDLNLINPFQRRIIVALQSIKLNPRYEEINFTKILLKVRVD